MIVTVITKYDCDMAEHYVGVVEGTLTPDQRADIAQAFNCDDEDEPDSNVMYFREIETVPNTGRLCEIYNIDGSEEIRKREE